MNKCLACYQPIQKTAGAFHPACSRKIFGTPDPPVIEFDANQIASLARQIVIKSQAVTGVQPKLSLNLEQRKDEWPRLTLVGLHGDYILKPPSAEYPALPENEDLTMHLAALVKVKTAVHSMVRLRSGELAYLTRRFDRDKGQKIAVEDACQLSENLTEHKYRGSVEMIGRLVYQFTANKGFEAQRLFELVLFSYLTGNADMHLKNFSLIENTFGEYELSPAYDLLSTALVIPDDKEESALTINGKRNKLKLTDFNAFALALKIPDKSLHAIYSRFKMALPAWLQFVKQSFLSKEMQEGYGALLQDRYHKIFR